MPLSAASIGTSMLATACRSHTVLLQPYRPGLGSSMHVPACSTPFMHQACAGQCKFPFANFPCVILRNRIADHPSAMGSFLREMIFFHLPLLSRQDVRMRSSTKAGAGDDTDISPKQHPWRALYTSCSTDAVGKALGCTRGFTRVGSMPQHRLFN